MHIARKHQPAPTPEIINLHAKANTTDLNTIGVFNMLALEGEMI